MSLSLLSDPIVKDQALVLRWFPVTDTSRVVVWFTSNHGKISTLIKGSQRSKSWVLGQYDLFYTCELLFYGKANEDLHLIRECSPIHDRSSLRTNWKACASASFVSDLLYRISPPLASAKELYQLAEKTLDALISQPSNPALLFWFEFKVLSDLGVYPDLSFENKGRAVFDYKEGKVFPAGNEKNLHALPLTAGSLSAMRKLVSMDTPERTSRIKLQMDQAKEIANHLDRFSEWHLDLHLSSRNKALELLLR